MSNITNRRPLADRKRKLLSAIFAKPAQQPAAGRHFKATKAGGAQRYQQGAEDQGFERDAGNLGSRQHQSQWFLQQDCQRQMQQVDGIRDIAKISTETVFQYGWAPPRCQPHQHRQQAHDDKGQRRDAAAVAAQAESEEHGDSHCRKIDESPWLAAETEEQNPSEKPQQPPVQTFMQIIRVEAAQSVSPEGSRLSRQAQAGAFS